MSRIIEQQWLEQNQTYLGLKISILGEELRQLSILELNETPNTKDDFLEAQREKLRALLSAADMPMAFQYLVKAFELTPFEERILLITAGAALNKDFAQLIRHLQEQEAILPSFGFLLRTFPDAHWTALLPEGNLQHWKLVKVHRANMLTHNQVSIDDFVLHFMLGLGEFTQDENLSGFVLPVVTTAELTNSQLSQSEVLSNQVRNALTAGNYPLLHLSGVNADDKLGIAALAANKSSLRLQELVLNLLPRDPYELQAICQRWNRSFVLTNIALFIDLTEWDELDSRAKDVLSRFISQLNGVLFLSTATALPKMNREVLKLNIDLPSRQEQQAVWRKGLALNGQSEAALSNLAYNFSFSSLAQCRIMAETQLEMQQLVLANGQVTEGQTLRTLQRFCRLKTRNGLAGLAQRIEPIASWEDLVLPAGQKAILQNISRQVSNRQRVYDDWGFGGKSNRGLGISALFEGESGTGKTMAAEVLANELNLDLYKIDLSQVINKYIGETEKNLSRIFTAAERCGAILLFDEADALFGKRSDVKDSHDRHANIEVSYLLQRMESYSGLAILTTNMKTALDKAFLRRLRFVVNFPFPGQAERAEIWKRVFPANTPTTALDLARLARLNIAGGNIKNIALNAAFLAAERRDGKVELDDLREAARREYVKLEKQMSPGESL